MKRFMLVSFLSCMLVGQTSCDWKDHAVGFGKGAGSVAKRSVQIFSVIPSTFFIGVGLGLFGPKKPNGDTVLGGGLLISALSLVSCEWLTSLWCTIADVDCLLRSNNQEQRRGKTKSFMGGRIVANAALLTGLSAGIYKFFKK